MPAPVTPPAHSVAQYAGRAIRQQRLALKWTQPKLAERSGLSQERISRYERGENALDLDTFVEICNALRVPSATVLQRAVDDFTTGLPLWGVDDAA